MHTARATWSQSWPAPRPRAGKKPDPTRETQQIADQAASTVQFLSSELDPFPYSNLEISQLPGMLSQSWPGLILSFQHGISLARRAPRPGRSRPVSELLLSRLMLTHETAHQWWGRCGTG